MKKLFDRILLAVTGALGDKRCPVCSALLRDTETMTGICPACLQKLTEESAMLCPVCRNPVSACTCMGTGLSPLHIFLGDRTWLAHTWYMPDSGERVTEKLLLTCKKKYSRTLSRYIAEVMAADLARILPENRRKGWILTYAPRSEKGFRRHGFDQCAELVRLMGQRLGIPVRQMLVRVGGGVQKDMETAAQRENNIAGAFAAVRVPEGCRVLLFDDIITTGATMRSAGEILADAGAAAVFPVAYAKTVHPKWRNTK